MARGVRRLVTLTLASAVATSLCCQFPGAPVSGADAGDGDGRPDMGDADPDCPWGARALFDPCNAQAETIENAVIVDATFDALFQYDTTMREFDGSGPTFAREAVLINGQMTELWIVKDFTITASGTLHVVGELPLIVAATGEVRIEGILDVGSRWRLDSGEAFGGRYEFGPGANVAAAGTDCAGTAGTTDNDGGGGGAGGGFGSKGGDGGLGRITNQMEGLPGVAGDAIELGAVGGLRAGCPGTEPGAANLGTTLPPRAPAGGALLLSALGEITIIGAIASGGATGIGQLTPGRGGGGGGGSGGLLVVQAPTMTISGGLFGNGGGGGGGADNIAMNANTRGDLIGDNGLLGPVEADGADGDPAENPRGVGGHGAIEGDAAEDGGGGQRGAGGGGGGTGHIALVVSGDATLTIDGATLSPLPAEVGVDLQRRL